MDGLTSQKLLNKKVSQFSGSEKENTLNLLRDLMDDFDMASDRNSELTYADMLCLTDGILNSPSYPILEVDTRIDFFQTTLHIITFLLTRRFKDIGAIIK